jgi:transglutaminase-like putative cysteine protease
MGFRGDQARRRAKVQIRAGFELKFESPQSTPMILMLNLHPSRMSDLMTPHRLVFNCEARARDYHDSFGNVCTRVVAPVGLFSVAASFVVRDSGAPDPVDAGAREVPVEDLPDDALIYLLGSRYCDTDRLSDAAWALFGNAPSGWRRVQTICDYVHDRLSFGYQHASATRTAFEGHEQRLGVCRDFAHLAISFCRSVNIPARYCTGYLGDIGVPALPFPMDFSAWFEAYLDGGWRAFDARHNRPRIGRLLMARGRDAADVALSTNFGPSTLVGFNVVTEEVV